jgi:hypothetical protein
MGTNDGGEQRKMSARAAQKAKNTESGGDPGEACESLHQDR